MSLVLTNKNQMFNTVVVGRSILNIGTNVGISVD